MNKAENFWQSLHHDSKHRLLAHRLQEVYDSTIRGEEWAPTDFSSWSILHGGFAENNEGFRLVAIEPASGNIAIACIFEEREHPFFQIGHDVAEATWYAEVIRDFDKTPLSERLLSSLAAYRNKLLHGIIKEESQLLANPKKQKL